MFLMPTQTVRRRLWIYDSDDNPKDFRPSQLARVVAADLANRCLGPLTGKSYRADSGETALFLRQLTHIVQEVQEAKYPENRAEDFIPVDSSINPGAQSFIWRQYDWAGMAKIISGNATDLPSIQVIGFEVAQAIRTLGIEFDYSLDDLRAAAMSGYPISTEKARLARRANENAVEQLAAFGSSSEGLPGFLNNTNVAVLTLVGFTGDWETATGEEILADLNTMANAMVVTTMGVWRPDTMLLPINRYSLVMSKPYSSQVPTPVGRIFLDQSPYIKNIDQWHFLDTADAELDGPRAVIYQRHPDVCQLVVPMRFQQQPPQPKGLSFVVPCESKIGGVSIKNPLGMSYCDGI